MKESFNQNIKNIGVGIAATVASIGIPDDAVAQQGLLGKIKDKIKDKIELVSHREQEQQEVAPEIKKDSIFYNSVGDKEGFEYPFDKEYKSDENYYRTVAYANMKGKGMTSEELLRFSEEEAEMNAQFNILQKEMKIEGEIKFYQENNEEPTIKAGDKKIHLGYVKIIDKVNFKNTRTGVCTTVIAVEILKNGVKVEKVEPKVETEKTTEVPSNKAEQSPIIETEKTRNEKFGESLSKDWQEYKVEKPEEPPIGNKPTKQPVYNPTQKVEKSDYHATFEDFKKAKEAEFDNFKKSQEEEFNKFKEGK